MLIGNKIFLGVGLAKIHFKGALAIRFKKGINLYVVACIGNVQLYPVNIDLGQRKVANSQRREKHDVLFHSQMHYFVKF